MLDRARPAAVRRARGLDRARGHAAPGASAVVAASACSPSRPRCGGSPGCGPRAATACPSSATPRPTGPWPPSRRPPRCCAASATGSSTAATSSDPGSSRASPTPSNLLVLAPATPSRWRRCVAAAVGALALPRPVPRHGRGRRAHRRRRPPVGRTRRWSARCSRRFTRTDAGLVAAQHAPRRAAGGPRPGPVPGRRGRRPSGRRPAPR